MTNPHKRGKWNRPAQDRHRQRNPKVTAEDAKARERAEAAYAKAQGVVWRVVTLEPCGLPPTRLS